MLVMIPVSANCRLVFKGKGRSIELQEYGVNY